MAKTIATIKSILKYNYPGSEIEEEVLEDGGYFYIFAPKWKAWNSNGCNTLSFRYFNEADWYQTRRDSISLAVKHIREGVSEASEDTINEMGWD